MLHVTNGDSAAHRLRAAGIPGDVLPWRDLLHEGPVPEGLDEARLRVARAGFVAALGWADEARVLADLEARDERLAQALASGEDIVLWFESDLYDLLQLVQILDRVAPARVRLVLAGEEKFTGVSELSDHELQDLLARGQPTRRARCPGVDRALVETARKMWAAFRAPDPTALAPLGQGTPALLALGKPCSATYSSSPGAAAGSTGPSARCSTRSPPARRRRSTPSWPTSGWRSGRSWATGRRSGTCAAWARDATRCCVRTPCA